MSRGVDEAWSADRGSNLGAVHFSKGFLKGISQDKSGLSRRRSRLRWETEFLCLL